MAATYRAALRVWSEELTASAIEAVFGPVPPSKRHDKGDPIRAHARPDLVRKESLCLYDSGVGEDQWLEVHIRALIRRMEALGDRVDQIRDKVSIDIVCFLAVEEGRLGSGGVLSADLLRSLARLRLDLVLDVYS